MSNTLRAWRASFTRRWHTQFDLCDTVDYDAGHQGRVALLILSIFPDCSRVLLAHAITHDQGESAAGDLPYTAKRLDPGLADRAAAIEAEAIRLQGFDLPNLTARETRILKLCDWLDAWLWMMRHAPHLGDRLDWRDQAQRALDNAAWLAVREEVDAIMHRARRS